MPHRSPSQNIGGALRAVLGITFRGRSPERLVYSRQRLVAAVIAALIMAIASHLLFFQMTLDVALVKLVFELGVLVVALNVVWSRRSARHRLLRMTLALFLVSAMGDGTLAALSSIPLDSALGPARQLLAITIMLAQIVGAANSVRYGIAVSWRVAGAWVLGYVGLNLLLFELAAAFL